MCTSRALGMFPLQVKMLKEQSFKDFELVFLNDLYELRKDDISKIIGDAFPYTYLPPHKISDNFAPGAAWNDLFTYARGELLYFMADYIVPHPDTLGRHWETHLKYPKTFISGRCWEVNITPQEFAAAKQYQYNDYRLSLFEHSYFRWSRLEENIYGSDKAGVQNFWTGRNDSCPLDAILKCNGFDEQFDGAHGYHDEDLAHRLTNLGLEYIIDLGSLCWQFKHQLSTKKPLRSDEEQHRLCKLTLIPQRIASGEYRVNPDRDLIKERDEWLSKR